MFLQLLIQRNSGCRIQLCFMNKQAIKRIALYGGAFDPPHIGHIAIITNLASLKFINQIWLLPCGDRNDKRLILSKDQRFELLQKIVKKLNLSNQVRISDQEINLSKKLKRMVPTIELLQFFETKYKQYQFYFVAGADLLQTINNWQSYQKLLAKQKFIIYPRKGFQLKIQKSSQNQSKKIEQGNKNLYLPNCYQFVQFYAPQISSSYIKNTLLDEKFNKKQKKQKIQAFLDEITKNLLSQKQFI